MSRRGSSAYRVLDEPVPGSLGHLTVASFWPLLAGMLGGLWLALPWYLLNGAAMGSATRRREWTIALGGLGLILAASIAVVLIVERLAAEGVIEDRIVGFCVLAIQLLKLGTYYWLNAVQSRSFELHRYYDGRVRNGAIVLIAGAIARPYLFGMLKHPILLLVLS